MNEQMPAVKATTLDEAWSNFDPLTPLPSGSPFYVQRKGDPLRALIRALLRVHMAAPKYFFSGHRGSGKSTELNRLLSHPDIQAKYFTVGFSVKEVCDPNNLSHVDVLLALGARIFLDFTERGGKLPEQYLRELEGWKGRTVERLNAKGATFETGAGFDIGQFFLSALLKIRTEHSTRQIIREEIEPRLSELIRIINDITIAVQARTRLPVLVVIDDLDKPPLDQARAIFHDAFTAITQPICAVVYTVPVAVFFSKAFTTIREHCFFLPNVKLHPKGHPEQHDPVGYETMREFVFRRMDEALIEPQALDTAIALSGGVFREMAFIMQLAASHAAEQDSPRIREADVRKAESRIRSDFRRILNEEDRRLLREVQATNEMQNVEKLAPLFHILAAIEYTNDENWCDVHPALRPLLAVDVQSQTVREVG